MSRQRISRTKLAKIDISFYERVKRIAARRVALGLDKNASPPTVQRKMIKHNLFPQIEKDLEIAEFLKDDLGQYSVIFSPFRFIIVIFLAVVMFGGLIYVQGLITNSLHDVGIQNEVNANQAGYVNLTNAADITFGKVNESIQALRMVAITMIFSEILLIFVVNSFTKIHPSMFMIWVFIVLLAVMLAAPVSNAYESLLQQGVYEGTLESFTGSNWILLNMPMIVMLVGILGGIFMFINILRSGGEQSL